MSSASTWISGLQLHCQQERGVWHSDTGWCEFPKAAPSAGATLPTPQEEEGCFSKGGGIFFSGDGSWFCDISAGGGANLASSDSCQNAGYVWLRGPGGEYCELGTPPPSCWSATDITSCGQRSGCGWVGSYCESSSLLTCSSYGSVALCGSQTQCHWDTTVARCVTSLNPVVTASGSHVTIMGGSSQIITTGSKASYTVTAETGYVLLTTVGGTCPSGSWSGNTYTTGTISQNCTVSFSGATSHTVTASGSFVSISPSSVQSVQTSSSITYTVTADASYYRSNSVGGTCPGGSWSGDAYTTGVITANCTISFQATASQSYTVAYSNNGGTAGTVPLDSTAYTAGGTPSILANTGNLTRIGKVFTGWNTASNGGGTSRPVGSSFTLSAANVTLYAMWGDIIYVSTTGSDGSGTGTAANPYATIAKALTVLTAQGGEIRVAGGTYAISSTITLVPNTRLRGGYHSSTWVQDVSTNQTKITPSAAGAMTFITCSSLSSDILLEGLNIERYSTNDSSNSYTGISLSSCPFVDIMGTSIRLATNNSSAYGLSISGLYKGEITGNFITVHDGNIAGRYAYAIYFSSPSSGSDLKIFSNVIDAGMPSLGNGYPRGIEIVNPSSGSIINAYVRNNTFKIGESSGGESYGLGLSNPTATPTVNLYFDNNLAFGPASPSGQVNGVYCPTGTSCNIGSMKNNNFFNLNYIYKDVPGSKNYTGIAGLHGGESNSLGNTAVEMLAAGYFTNYSSRDFTLSATAPTSITTGGLDGGALSWGFSKDAVGTTRTGNGAIGWSMGAYEK